MNITLRKNFVKTYKISMTSCVKRQNNIGKEKMLSKKKNSVRTVISIISRMIITTGVVERMLHLFLGRCGGAVVNAGKMH